MNNGLKWALVSLPILVGGFIVYRTLTKEKRLAKKKAKEQGTTPQITTQTTTTSGGGGGGGVTRTNTTVKPDFPIGIGSRGSKVKELQQAIVDDGQPNVVALLGKNPTDGQFGTGTEKAVKALLGKTTIDSQADIIKIINLKITRAAAQQVATGDANRKFYGKLIVDGLCKNGKELYAVKSAQIFGYRYDSTKTRSIETRSWKYETGDRAKPWNKCSNIVSQTMDASGFVTIWTKESGNDWRYNISPYDFEVK
jgi:peptidoglycan hydrolase-like protein with peptidoglycan-binding domain